MYRALALIPLLLAALPLDGANYRVLVSTDLGGDPDDIQSLYRLLHYSDVLNIEGIVSSPGPGAQNAAPKIRDWIRRIEVDRLRARGHKELIEERAALAAVKQGQTAAGAPDASRKTEGSDWIIARAKAPDPEDRGRPLWILVWGSLTDVAQALHDDPSIASKIRIYSIGSSNTFADPASRDFIFAGMQDKWPELWWIENGVMPRRSRDTFRGVYQGGVQSGEWGNTAFIDQVIRRCGAPGGVFPVATSPAGTLKEGDSPSMLYLLSPVIGRVGNVDDPTSESWGGRFRPADKRKYPNYYVDLDAPAGECQTTVNKWRVQFLSDWKKRWEWYGAERMGAQPLRLHPDNPRYFLFRGKPAVLVTSGEHYGAVLNLDFDYVRYLETLRAARLNLTRTFPGAYREIPGSFNIERNTLAPTPGRFICPWPRSSEPGAADGLNKFDLSKWGDAYFARLKDFVREAGRRGIVVELSLFCPFYEQKLWEMSPLNIRNNVNGIGGVERTDALTLKDKRLVAAEDTMVRKIVTELRDFDNLYYEICNEPYFGGVTLDWQRHIAATITETEAGLAVRHLIAQNIANGSRVIEDPNPLVSLFNFHYSRPPDSVRMNYELMKAIGCNETGFDGGADSTYRIQGWDFLLAGGALYNNLDYSFTAGHEDGTFPVPEKQPGGGSRDLRRQLGILRGFIERFDFIHMQPLPSIIRAGVPDGASIRVLGAPGVAYAIYLHHGTIVKEQKRSRYVVNANRREARLTLDLPAGTYKAEWLNTKSGKVDKAERFRHAGGERVLASPTYAEDLALTVRKSG